MQPNRGTGSEWRGWRQRQIGGCSAGLVQRAGLRVRHVELDGVIRSRHGDPGRQPLRCRDHERAGFTKAPGAACRNPHQGMRATGGFAEFIDHSSEWVARDGTDPDAGCGDSVPVMQCGDGGSASAPNRHGLVPARDARILVKLDHANANRPAHLSDGSKDAAGNSVDGAGGHRVVGVVLDGLPLGEACALRVAEPPVQPKPHEDLHLTTDVPTQGPQCRAWVQWAGGIWNAHGSGAVQPCTFEHGGGRWTKSWRHGAVLGEG